ncbi:MAG: C-terminal helicase domain-containing protein, partial [Candidatus Cloacimonetes bacterium]|nr:C-terminal helicase domain-containing protein [Candidatus Cloacimonadota bacterium]
ILTFYTDQEAVLREKLRQFPNMRNKLSRFTYNNCSIRLATVDFFQGQEADIVFLSMVNTYRDGFLDTPNRLNVAITRARHQMVIVGKYDYFKHESRTDELRNLAEMYVKSD